MSERKESGKFVNEGLIKWEKLRAEWVGKRSNVPRGGVRARNVNVDQVIESVFSTSGGGLLPEPLPLGQMIDILIDFWEADGLFD